MASKSHAGVWLQLLLRRPLPPLPGSTYLALGSCLFLFLCFLQCRPGRRLLLAAPTFERVSAAVLRRRAPVRPLQRVSRACRSKRSAAGAASRPPAPPRLGGSSSQEVGCFTSRQMCGCCRWSFETHLAWRHPRLPLFRTFGARCWQPLRRLSTGTTMWCWPETNCPVPSVVACCLLLRCHLLPRAPSLRTLLSQAPDSHRLHARGAMLASALQVLLTSRTLTAQPPLRTSQSLNNRRGLSSVDFRDLGIAQRRSEITVALACSRSRLVCCSTMYSCPAVSRSVPTNGIGGSGAVASAD